MGISSPFSGERSINAAKTTNYTRNKFVKMNGNKASGKDRETKNVEKSGSGKCTGCGRNSKHPKAECPAQDVTCHNCSKTGHYSVVCRHKDKFAAAIRICGVLDNHERILNVRLITNLGKHVINMDAIPDTGAGISVMGIRIFRKSGLSSKFELGEPLPQKITSVNKMELQQAGCLQTTIIAENEQVFNVIVAVCFDVDEFYIDRETCMALRIISETFPFPNTYNKGNIVVNAIKENMDHRQYPTENIDTFCTLPMVVSSQNAEPGYVNQEVWPDRMDWIVSLPEHSDDMDLFDEIQNKIQKVYAVVFDDSQELRPMKGGIVGEPMKINLKENYTPFAVHAARFVPYALRDKVVKTIQYMIEKKIILKLGDIPTEWCHPVVIVPKPNGDIRFCVDFTKLNTEVDRTLRHTKTPAEAVSGFKPKDKYFAKLDLVKGYWQMPLHPESQLLTTFITIGGRYCFLDLPMGFVSTGDLQGKFLQRRCGD